MTDEQIDQSFIDRAEEFWDKVPDEYFCKRCGAYDPEMEDHICQPE